MFLLSSSVYALWLRLFFSSHIIKNSLPASCWLATFTQHCCKQKLKTAKRGEEISFISLVHELDEFCVATFFFGLSFCFAFCRQKKDKKAGVCDKQFTCNQELKCPSSDKSCAACGICSLNPRNELSPRPAIDFNLCVPGPSSGGGGEKLECRETLGRLMKN